MFKLKGIIPVMESFGFDQALRSETSGQAFQQCAFSHWDIVSGDIENVESKLFNVVNGVRVRKHKLIPKFKVEMPDLSDYLDKL